MFSPSYFKYFNLKNICFLKVLKYAESKFEIRFFLFLIQFAQKSFVSEQNAIFCQKTVF